MLAHESSQLRPRRDMYAPHDASMQPTLDRYRGYSIHTRCVDGMLDGRRSSERYVGSFRVMPDSVDEAPWQQFSAHGRSSCVEARSQALKAAKTSVDGHLEDRTPEAVSLGGGAGLVEVA